MKKKEIQEYLEKYGHVPKDFFQRFAFLLTELRITEKQFEKIKKGIKSLLKAKWETFSFVIYFHPKATPRARLGARNVFYVRDASSNSEFFKKFMEELEESMGVVSTPCKILVDTYVATPNQMTREEKIYSEMGLTYPLTKPDWDNAGKTYSDMIQKHLILDDSLIIDGRVRKFYSARPRIEIKLEYMTKYDCKFNKRKVEGWKFYNDLRDRIEEKDPIV